MKGNEVFFLSSLMKVKGPALGLIGEAVYALGEVELSNFDKLIAYTDGLYETTNLEGEQMGVERLCDVLESNSKDIEYDLDALLEKTHIFAGDAEYGDDVCLVGMELT